MKYFFHPEAEIEFNKAIDYYEECNQNLGLEFATEIYMTIQRILNFPKAWQILDSDIRRCLTNRFLMELFIIKNNEIVILAVM